jgi:acyl-CoA thioesterase FadM
MKNLLVEIKKCAESRYQQKFTVQAADCDANGKLQVWVLLNWVEASQMEAATCIHKIAPQYKKDIKSVDLQMHGPAHAGDTIEIEARFYEIDKRQVELKVFARKIKPDNSSKRICRASYTFKATYDQTIPVA